MREAVEYAIDKEAIAKSFGYGYWQAPYQIVPRGSPLAYNPDFNPIRKYDQEKAKQLLVEAGYSKGFDTTIICQSSAMKDISVAMQGYLAKVGINVKLEYPDPGLFGNLLLPWFMAQ